MLRFFLLRLCFAFILQGYEKVPVIHVVLFVIESAFLPRYDCRRYEVAFLGIGRIVLILSFEFGGVILVERRLSVSWLRGCDLLLGCRLRGLSGNLLCLLRLLLGLLLLCELIVDLRFAFVKLFENVFERRLGALSMFDLIGVAVYVCMLLRLRVGVVFISAQFLLFFVFALGVEFCKHLFEGLRGLCLLLTFAFRLFLLATFFFFVGEAFCLFGAQFFFFHAAKHRFYKLSVLFALSKLLFGLFELLVSLADFFFALFELFCFKTRLFFGLSQLFVFSESFFFADTQLFGSFLSLFFF